MVLGEIESALAILDRVKKAISRDTSLEELNVADRFILLFEKHGVHRNQIPRYFGHGLTIDDISKPKKLLAKLDHEILRSVCDLFSVRLEWFEGVDKQIYPVHHVYKQPEKLRPFLESVIENEPPFLHFDLYISHALEEDDSLFVISEAIGELGETTIYRYHIFGGWSYRYWKCRADLAACTAIAEKYGLHISSVSEKDGKVGTFASGKGFIADLDKLPTYRKRDKWFKKQYTIWYPDELLNNPVKLVERLYDGEWGKASAVERWLYYCEKGYLETGFNNVTKRAFSQYLENLKPD